MSLTEVKEIEYISREKINENMKTSKSSTLWSHGWEGEERS